MQVLEQGTYTRYKTPRGLVLEVFLVTSVGGDEKEPLSPGRFYYQRHDGSEPVGPFDTREAALEAGC